MKKIRTSIKDSDDETIELDKRVIEDIGKLIDLIQRKNDPPTLQTKVSNLISYLFTPTKEKYDKEVNELISQLGSIFVDGYDDETITTSRSDKTLEIPLNTRLVTFYINPLALLDKEKLYNLMNIKSIRELSLISNYRNSNTLALQVHFNDSSDAIEKYLSFDVKEYNFNKNEQQEELKLSKNFNETTRVLFQKIINIFHMNRKIKPDFDLPNKSASNLSGRIAIQSPIHFYQLKKIMADSLFLDFSFSASNDDSAITFEFSIPRFNSDDCLSLPDVVKS